MSEGDHKDWAGECRALFRIGWPLIINNIAVAGMQFADAVMAGRLGAHSLASVAVGASVWFLGFSFVLGIMMAISPIVARHFGAGSMHLIGRYTRQGLYLALLFGVLIFAISQLAVPAILAAVGIDSELQELTAGYVAAISWGAPGIFMFLALRFTTEGIGVTRPLMYTSIMSLVCNVFLNYVLAFGHFGAPALGAVGLGYASAITMWLVMFALGTYVVLSDGYKRFDIFGHVAPFRPDVLREILLLGLPIAVTIAAETGLFSAVSILMGTRGAVITAAHQIALNFASTMFMIPLALSAATTVRVGQLLGAGNQPGARFSGGVGILICGIFMTMSALFLLVFRNLVVAAYTTDEAVKAIAISLLFVAVAFQIADGVQIGAAGALRGYKDTRMPMLINTVSYWALGFPLSYLAAITYQLPPWQVWIGFIVALTAAAVLLSWRFARLSRPVQP